jgi:hypothetical protein
MATCTTWPWYVQCFVITVPYKDPVAVILPESILFREGHEALVARLEKYASFAKHSNVAKAVDEALHAEKEGIDPAQLGKALLQIAANNSFSVDA